MTGDEIVDRLMAWQAGRPLPRGETLHLPVCSDGDVLILAFVRMGAESSPWGIAAGHPGTRPHLFTVPEPRDRDLVAIMAAAFAPLLLSHLGHPDYATNPVVGVPAIVRQVWLPNPTHVDMLHFLNYSYTFARRSDDPDRLRTLNALGRACGWLFREGQRPGHVHVIAATEALRKAYVFPADDIRQAHLAFLLAWLTTPGDRTARMEEAAVAEQRAIATTLDPRIERKPLLRAVDRWLTAKKANDRSRMMAGEEAITRVLEDELLQRYRLVEQTIDVLRHDGRRVNIGVAELSAHARNRLWKEYLETETQLRSDPSAMRRVPAAETDRSPARAAAGYHELEADEQFTDITLLHDDRQMQKRLIAAGKAIDGTIVAVTDEGRGRTTRPVWVVESTSSLPLHLRVDETLCVVGLPKREGRIRAIDTTADGRSYRFEIAITGLMTRPREAGTRVLSASSTQLIGQRVTMVRTANAGAARRKVMKLWNRQAPGAWLTLPATPTFNNRPHGR